MQTAATALRLGYKYGPTLYQNRKRLASAVGLYGGGRLYKKARRIINKYKGKSNDPNGNTETAKMVNNTEPAASLYVRKTKRKYNKALGRRRRRFAKRVNRVIYKKRPLNVSWERANDFTMVSNLTLEDDVVFQAVFKEDAGLEQRKTMIGLGLAHGQFDVNRIGNDIIKDAGWVSAGTIQNQQKNSNNGFFFRASLKMTIQNPNINDTNDYDVYTCTAAQDIASATYKSPALAMIQCLLDCQVPQGETLLNERSKGVTPFDVPGFGQWWIVNNVTRIRLGPQQKNTFSLYTKGFWDYEKFVGKFARKGVTKGFLVIARPNRCYPTVATVYQDCNMNCQKSFRWKPIGLMLPNGQSLVNQFPINSM